MKSLFDMMAIFSGIIGLGGLIINASDLTPENAAMQSARAIIVVAFVVVPFFVARAIEKTNLERPGKHIMPERTRQPQTLSQTTYFDYLFQPGSAYDWRNTSVAVVRSNRSARDARPLEM